jgi:cytochrome c oxidase cbb3-type subunit I/II
VLHFQDPKQVTQGSIMPEYPWLEKSQLKFDVIPSRMAAMRTLGVPYSDEDIERAVETAQAQARQIAEKVKQDKGPAGLEDKKVVALIAYLDRLGKDLFATPPTDQPPAAEPPEVAQAPPKE